jgi:hypothetical protein
MEAWYMDDSAEDQRKPHHRNPPEYVSLDKLAGALTTDPLPYRSLDV